MENVLADAITSTIFLTYGINIRSFSSIMCRKLIKNIEILKPLLCELPCGEPWIGTGRQDTNYRPGRFQSMVRHHPTYLLLSNNKHDKLRCFF